MITSEFLKPYTKEKKRHKFYKRACELAEDMLIHFDGKFPDKLIGKRRPSESKEIFAYRKEIFESPTQQDCGKVENSLMKIRKSQDWSIKYPKVEKKARDGESLYDYMEEYFPKHTSFTNWVFQYGLRQYLTDPNSVVLWMPLSDVKDNEYLKPYPILFSSKQVYDVTDQYYLLLSSETSTYASESGRVTYDDGKIFYYVDSTMIVTFVQKDAKENYDIYVYEHNLGRIPVTAFSAIICEEAKMSTLYKSRLHCMIPSMNEAAREYSDVQAEIVQHIHTTMWAYETQSCKECNGNGTIPVKDKPAVKCGKCGGRGTIPFDPYQMISVRVPGNGEMPLPTPFAGYLQKQIDIAVLQDKRIFNHRLNALGACNMEFLLQPPSLTQSGVAKEVDRAELNTFVHAVAEDLVKFMDDGYLVCAMYRYGYTAASYEEIEKITPEITVPEKYDMLSESYLADELVKLKGIGSQAVINASMKEYVSKKFNADPQARQFINDVIDLDPFASENDDSLLMKLQNDGIKKIDYIIHCNINAIVKQAYDTIEGFEDLGITDKKAAVEKLAATLMKDISSQGTLNPAANPMPVV